MSTTGVVAFIDSRGGPARVQRGREAGAGGGAARRGRRRHGLGGRRWRRRRRDSESHPPGPDAARGRQVGVVREGGRRRDGRVVGTVRTGRVRGGIIVLRGDVRGPGRRGVRGHRDRARPHVPPARAPRLLRPRLPAVGRAVSTPASHASRGRAVSISGVPGPSPRRGRRRVAALRPRKEAAAPEDGGADRSHTLSAVGGHGRPDLRRGRVVERPLRALRPRTQQDRRLRGRRGRAVLHRVLRAGLRHGRGRGQVREHRNLAAARGRVGRRHGPDGLAAAVGRGRGGRDQAPAARALPRRRRRHAAPQGDARRGRRRGRRLRDGVRRGRRAGAVRLARGQGLLRAPGDAHAPGARPADGARPRVLPLLLPTRQRRRGRRHLRGIRGAPLRGAEAHRVGPRPHARRGRQEARGHAEPPPLVAGV
mmetsp:Transcript_29549/g.91382  ORF Transcript_29549/g.91382 Transcript_29549/m.91382 type:complete len:423 (-) Transcript_29549:141-1409(-)